MTSLSQHEIIIGESYMQRRHAEEYSYEETVEETTTIFLKLRILSGTEWCLGWI